MSDSQVEEIKNRLNILDIVGSYVKLTKTGVNHRGICPFHKEKGPSFFVSPSRQMFKCFGCGKGGDVLTFIQEVEGVEFGDALRILAQKAGVELKRENPQVQSERHRLYEICELACKFFEKQLDASAIGKEAKEYLLRRGIKEENIKKWRLGYSPDMWQGLSDFLVSKGFQRDEIVKAGLAVHSEKGGQPYDRFRGRIIFPIFDASSQVIGFGARIFKEADKKEIAKYINNPQTALYDKSNVLYGINFAKVPVRKQNQCVLVEGYTDAIMCHQAGFENTVAVSGTALTERHLAILKRYTENLLLSFDMDVAGDNATKRGINLAESAGFNLKIINRYDSAKDPAEIILENPGNWENSVEKARGIMDYYFDSAFLKFDRKTPEGKKEIGKVILPAIKRLANKIEQSHWLQKLSAMIMTDEKVLAEEMKNTKAEEILRGPTPQRSEEGPRGNSGGRRQLLEEKIVSLLAKDPANLEIIKVEHFKLFSENIKRFLLEVKKAGSFSAFEALPEAEDFKSLLDDIALRSEVDLQDDDSDEVVLCLEELKRLAIKEYRHELAMQIKQAEAEGDQEKVKLLMEQFKQIG